MEDDTECSDEYDMKIISKSQKDRGWAWVITAGATLHLFFHIGISRSFGLFFVEFLSFYDTNSSVLSGMIAAKNVVYTLSSLFVLNIGNRIFSNRILIITGGIMLSAGYLITAFSPNIVCLVLAQSIFIGIGTSCTTAPIFVVLNSYFEKRLGFSNSLVNVGGGIGSFVMPFVIKSLLDHYAFRGALLIISALILNDVVVGSVMRPFPTVLNVENSGGVNDTSASLNDNINKMQKPLYNDISVSRNTVTKCNEFENKDTHHCEEQLLGHLTDIKRAVSHSEENIDAGENHSLLWKGDQLTRSSDMHANTSTIENLSPRIQNSQTNTNPLRSEAKENDATVPSISKKTAQSNKTTRIPVLRLSDILIVFEMLKNYRLLLVLFVAFVSFCAITMSGTYIPPFATDQNVTSSETAILVMVAGGCDIVSRLILTTITDSKVIHRYQIIGAALGILGIATLFNPLFNTFKVFVGYSAVHGFFGSVYFATVYLLLRERVGPEKMSPAFSLMITTHGLSSATIAPLLGYLRDTSGSYIIPFYVIGIGLVIGSIATFCTPLVKRLEEKRLEKTTKASK